MMLVLTAVGSVVLVAVGRRLRGRSAATVLCRVFAAVLVVIAGIHVIHGFLPGNFRMQGSIPLQLSDLLRFVSAYALWTRKFWATSVVYYWGLTFNPMSLITPNLHYTWSPLYDFSMYWSLHILVMWAAIFLTWGLAHRPTWRSYWLGIVATLAWAAVTFAFNVFTGTNYGFLNATPTSSSLLDVMGPWPIYLLSAFVAMVVIWAAITWPWMIVGRVRSDSRGKPALRD